VSRPKLSVILPGIRVRNWENFYDKLESSFNGEFELIIISPYNLPESLQVEDDVIHIQDWGSPARCQQIGLVNATGEYVTWGADDGYFLDDKLTEAVDLLEKSATSKKDIVTCKYIEGADTALYEDHMEHDEYYKINFSNGLRSKYIPEEYWILNVGIVNTEYAKEIGGWDSRFDVTTLAHMDFAVRTQRDGSKYIMMEEPIFTCTHTPGMSGDHGPIHISHTTRDEPMFREIYNEQSSVNRKNIELNNWMNSPPRWARRFGVGL
tara:strand:+ start:1541 stop:2335 length:795 start_codon:yes stop_codon:yes gene_type:complete